jgi:hypothetical protein
MVCHWHPSPHPVVFAKVIRFHHIYFSLSLMAFLFS